MSQQTHSDRLRGFLDVGLLEIGIALSSEKDTDVLLESILVSLMNLTNCEGGTIYLVDQAKQNLKFEILRNKVLNVHQGGTSGKRVTIPNLPLYNPDGSPDLAKVVCSSYHLNSTVNIDDAYNNLDYDFSGTKKMDTMLHYHSQSFLTVPMRDHESEIIGILQLINSKDDDQKVAPFPLDSQTVVESLASQAAIALTNRLLINRLEELFESFIGIINGAIDDKSPYTAGHCGRVPELTLMIADAVNDVKVGPLCDFNMTEEDRHELKIAGLLHDCGKITTPVHIVDKATKLEAIFDRIALIESRVELVMRDLEIKQLKGEIDQATLKSKQEKLKDDFAFISKTNIGGEFMSDDHLNRIRSIANEYSWTNMSGESLPFLSDDEVKNLSIRAGTLTDEDRQVINHHIEVTITMLEKLPWPKHLRNVPEYAGGHHERMDGKGYPRGLTRDQMSVQARCMAIADIFEALTASDRPYKKGKMLSESLAILGKMKLGSHIDPDLFDVFIWERVYEKYARQFLPKEQIDEVDVAKIPGYNPPPIKEKLAS